MDPIIVNRDLGFEVTFRSPIYKDVATASIMMNAIVSVLHAKPGFNILL